TERLSRSAFVGSWHRHFSESFQIRLGIDERCVDATMAKDVSDGLYCGVMSQGSYGPGMTQGSRAGAWRLNASLFVYFRTIWEIARLLGGGRGALVLKNTSRIGFRANRCWRYRMTASPTGSSSGSGSVTSFPPFRARMRIRDCCQSMSSKSNSAAEMPRMP